jgi:hypothetical protein
MRTLVRPGVLLATLAAFGAFGAFATLGARRAAADEPPPAGYLVSLPLLGLERGSFAVQGEHLAADHWALTASLGVRRAEAGDYDARGLALGGGTRYFFFPFDRWGRGGGAFLHARLDATWRWLVYERTGDDLGDSFELAGSLYVGWRLIAWRHLELTPELGFSVAREWTSAALAASTHVAPAFGLSLGYAW